MQPNPVRQIIRKGQCAFGLFLNIPSPGLVEVAGLAGFDFCIIDQEHGPIDEITCEAMVRAAASVGLSPIVRIPIIARNRILKALDTGALGVQVPHVQTAAEAESAVRFSRYPLEGGRGIAFTVRAVGYGARNPAEYLEWANREPLVIVQVENLLGLRNLDEILKVKGVDVIFIGPADLSVSMGFPGRADHPEVLSVIEDHIARIREAGVTPGFLVTDPASAAKWIRLGVQYMAGDGVGTILKAYRSLVQGYREALAL